jgi:hypothetical protein
MEKTPAAADSRSVAKRNACPACGPVAAAKTSRYCRAHRRALLMECAHCPLEIEAADATNRQIAA